MQAAIYSAPCRCGEEHQGTKSQAGEVVHKEPIPSCTRVGSKLEAKIPGTEVSPRTHLCFGQTHLVRFYWNRSLIITGGQVKEEFVPCWLMLRAQLPLLSLTELSHDQFLTGQVQAWRHRAGGNPPTKKANTSKESSSPQSNATMPTGSCPKHPWVPLKANLLPPVLCHGFGQTELGCHISCDFSWVTETQKTQHSLKAKLQRSWVGFTHTK